jgi:beta-1,4-N-acetylglucosaminyltransferase
MKVCIVSSCGGHLTEVRCLLKAYCNYDYLYVLNDRVVLPPDMQDKTQFITHSERDWKLILNLWEAFWILWKERPTIILSTGAGPVVPFSLIGRLFFSVKIVYVETITRIEKPSLTGKIMYYLAHDFFYQWESLGPHFPKGTYGGVIL